MGIALLLFAVLVPVVAAVAYIVNLRVQRRRFDAQVRDGQVRGRKKVARK